MSSILITGVSGSGKTAISKQLNKMGYKSYNMDGFPGLFTMLDKRTGKPVVDHDNANLEKVKNIDWVCDIKKLKDIIANESSNLAFYCGNATNLDEMLPLFDKIVLLKVSPEKMRHRLTYRTSNDFGRTSEVQDWLMTWKEKWESDMQEKGAAVIDADGEIEQVTKKVIEKAKNV